MARCCLCISFGSAQHMIVLELTLFCAHIFLSIALPFVMIVILFCALELCFVAFERSRHSQETVALDPLLRHGPGKLGSLRLNSTSVEGTL